MHVIGIAGRAGAGKTTFAHCLVENYIELTGKATEPWILPFAQPLKDLAVSLGWDGVKDERGRKLLQLLGTDVCRNLIDEDYWLNKWSESKHFAEANGCTLAIADDVRFPNEATHILDIGKLYKIQGRAYEDTPLHESEQDLPVDEEYCINNDSTLEALNMHARVIIKEVIKWVY